MKRTSWSNYQQEERESKFCLGLHDARTIVSLISGHPVTAIPVTTHAISPARHLVTAGGADGEPARRSEIGEIPAEARVLVSEAVAPAAEKLAVDLHLLELGDPRVLEPLLHTCHTVS